MDWAAIIGSSGVIFGLIGTVFYYAVVKPLTDNIAGLRRAIEMLNDSVGRIEEKRQDMDKRLVKVEQSVKSAHHRLDTFGQGGA